MTELPRQFAEIYDRLDDQPHLQEMTQDFYYESLVRQQATESFKLNNTNFKLLMKWNQYVADFGQHVTPLHEISLGWFGMNEYISAPFSITQVDWRPDDGTQNDWDSIRTIHKLGL